jgi:SAM-dependent methyltransferase
MAHFQQLKFVETVKTYFPEFFGGAKVLEVGSWIVNETVRVHFQACDYVGVDVAEGPGVDLVGSGHDINLPTGAFDIVISCECFEHNPHWLETFLNMARMLRPGGLFVFTCASTGRGEHGTNRTTAGGSLTSLCLGSDYYRNLARRDFQRSVPLKDHFADHLLMINRYSKDLYFAGIKIGPAPDPALPEKLAALRRAAARINVRNKLTITRAVSAHAEWWGKWTLTRIIGERNYHNVRYLVGHRSPARGTSDSPPPARRG